MKTEMKPKRSPLLAGALSLLPGLGQMSVGEAYRGVAVFLGTLVTAGMVVWYGQPVWYVVPVVIWLWNIWDAMSLAGQGRARSILFPLAVSLFAAYAIGWQVVQIDFSKADMNRAIAILRPMLRPDFVQERREQVEMWVEIEVPCLDKPVSGQNAIDGKTASVQPNCAGVGKPVTASFGGLWPDTDANIWWEDPSGMNKMVAPGEASMLVARADAAGNVTATFIVPSTALVSIHDVTVSPPHRVYARQYRPLGGLELSFVGGEVFKGALVTVGMALMATLLGMLFAVPLSFLAAHNLMSGNPVTLAIYYITRTLLNILRSIESLIIAIVFVVIVGLGPFAGVLALALHSVAALAKLYSEVIEGIDPGPIEAVRATGADWLQIARYAVIPQIVPPFTAFTIYRWDINVRSATIVGFVGGGGLGFLLIELIRINDMRGVSAVFIAIAIIVIAMDYISAKIRARLV
jgi:phosphonate transport system permease protein